MDRRDVDIVEEVGHFLLGFLSGLMVGGVLGILLAPHRGDITRRKIRRRAENVKDQMEEKVEGLKS